ncbi:MAG: hypothetical protein Kow00124_05360 [Anaerolineae bacterium]
MRVLVRIFNHRAYPVFSLTALAITAVLLARDGLTVIEGAVLAALIILAYGVWRLLVTTQTHEADSIRAVRQTLANGERPTIIEFFSSYCVGCMAMKPIVDRLESEAGERLQIIRLNIDQEPGRTLMDEYGVVFTPTFVYFDKDGNKLRESIGVLDRARVLFDLDVP